MCCAVSSFLSFYFLTIFYSELSEFESLPVHTVVVIGSAGCGKSNLVRDMLAKNTASNYRGLKKSVKENIKKNLIFGMEMCDFIFIMRIQSRYFYYLPFFIPLEHLQHLSDIRCTTRKNGKC